MGYKIVYGEEPPAQIPSTARLRTMTAAFLLLGCLLTRMFWSDGTALLRQCLLPDAENVAEAAFCELMDELHAGAPMGESVLTFCRTVVSDAAIPKT